MRNNKILATAIATALAGTLSAGGVSAGTMTVTYPDTSITTPPIYVATEEISINQTLSDACPTGSSPPTSTVRVQVDYVTDNDLVANDQIVLQLNEGSDAAETAFFQTKVGNDPGASAG